MSITNLSNSIFTLFLLSILLACSSPPQGAERKTSSSDSAFFSLATASYGVYDPASGAFQNTTLDKAPKPLGGEDHFMRTMYSGLNYPPQAREKGIQGKVVVRMVINEFGMLVDSGVQTGIGWGCDEEALKAIQRGGQVGFEPALKDGKPVKVSFDVPITFSLGN